MIARDKKVNVAHVWILLSLLFNLRVIIKTSIADDSLEGSAVFLLSAHPLASA